MRTESASPTLPTTSAALPAAAGPEILRGPVLLATDGAAPSDATALVARRIAERLGERLHVLTALEPLAAYTLPGEMPVFPPELEPERLRRVEADVIARLEPVLGSRAGWHLDVRYGAVGRVIAEAAREWGASLIVVGSGSHRAVNRLLGEEVSLQVIRHASCPVLAVAPTRDVPLRRAVVGIDFSAASFRAALTALALLDLDDADPALDVHGVAMLSLVHVRSPFEHEYPILGSFAAAYDADIAARFTRLREYLRPYAGGRVTIETRSRIGSVPAFLGEVAEAIDAQLVAVGTHGPGWVERLFVGSVATSVLRQTARTMLVAPTPPAAERTRLELGVLGQAVFDRPDDWAGALDEFTRRNVGRTARLEVSDPVLGGMVVEATAYRLVGVTFDRHDGALEVMLAGEKDGGHLTHRVRHVRSLELVGHDAREARGGGQGDRALLVEDARGHTVLTFVD